MFQLYTKYKLNLVKKKDIRARDPHFKSPEAKRAGTFIELTEVQGDRNIVRVRNHEKARELNRGQVMISLECPFKGFRLYTQGSEKLLNVSCRITQFSFGEHPL